MEDEWQANCTDYAEYEQKSKCSSKNIQRREGNFLCLNVADLMRSYKLFLQGCEKVDSGWRDSEVFRFPNSHDLDFSPRHVLKQYVKVATEFGCVSPT